MAVRTCSRRNGRWTSSASSGLTSSWPLTSARRTLRYGYARQSMELTHRWLDRCIARMNETEPLYGHEQMLFPIVQGSTYDDLRKAGAHADCRARGGNAIGGLSVGEPHEEMYASVDLCTEILPEDKPRYLMGVGTPANLLEHRPRGGHVRLRDPTRNARNSMLFTRQGTLNMRNRKWEDDFSALDPMGTADVDRRYSKAYVRHLFRAGEILALQIGTVHNLVFYLDLMREARERIADGTFRAWKDALVPVLAPLTPLTAARMRILDRYIIRTFPVDLLPDGRPVLRGGGRL